MQLTGLVGRPVSHSIGQTVYNRYFSQSGLDCIYLSIDVTAENLGRFVSMAREKFLGYNVTIPHKVEIMKHLDSVSDEAEAIGSVNTVVTEGGSSMGYNTDFLAMGNLVREIGLTLEDSTVAVRGSGGVARTVICYISLYFPSARVTVVSRSPADARARLHAQLQGKNTSYVNPGEALGADILINCSPIGMWPEVNSSPFTAEEIEGCSAGIDLVYNPQATNITETLIKQGKQAVGGLGFFVDQGYESLKLMTGKRIDRNLLEKIAAEAAGGLDA